MVRKISNSDLSKLLRSVSSVYLLSGENRFKILAYERAADIIEGLTKQVYDMWESNKQINISGIGPSINAHINQYFSNPSNNHLIKTKEKLPDAVYVLMDVPGIGARNAYRLTQELKLDKTKNIIEKLRGAIAEGAVASLEGFGEKSAKTILENIEIYIRRSKEPKRILLSQALTQADQIIKYLLKNNKVKKAVAVGSLRRMLPTIGDIDIVVVCSGHDSKSVVDYFTEYSNSTRVVAKGSRKGGIITVSGLRIDLRTVSYDIYGSMLQYFTGSKTHNIKLRDYALKRGLSLSEYGIKELRKNRAKHIKFSNEKSLYKFLGLQYIPPEIRQGADEISVAKKKELPVLVKLKDLRGDLQMHSSYKIEPSHDLGKASYRELLKRAENIGYEYVAFTDHNPSIGSHSEEQITAILKKRFDMLKRLQRNTKKCKLYISLEVDIKPSGELAIPKDATQYLDFILIAIHSSFRMKGAEMTKRILKALAHPKVKIFAHPTARLLNKREEIEADWKHVFREAKKRNIAFEINADPNRLDLPDRLVNQARYFNSFFTIGTDAHSLGGLDNMYYGVSVARRGLLTKNDIMNTKSHKDINRWLLER